VLEDGAIAEQGTHQSLLEQNGIYAEMYRHQQEMEKKIHS
jgi:ABC-type multidrug transport system fused ATPase/permease subunit